MYIYIYIYIYTQPSLYVPPRPPGPTPRGVDPLERYVYYMCIYVFLFARLTTG